MKKLFFSGKEFYRVLAMLKGKNKLRLEKALNITLDIIKSKTAGTMVIVSKKREYFSEHLASVILEALALGFSFNAALQLKDGEYELRKLNIKDYSRESKRERAKARLIGRQGRTKRTLETLSGCSIVLTDHTVAILGKSSNIEIAIKAIMALLRGSKQANVYRFLEKSQVKLRALEEENIEEMIEK